MGQGYEGHYTNRTLAGLADVQEVVTHLEAELGDAQERFERGESSAQELAKITTEAHFDMETARLLGAILRHKLH